MISPSSSASPVIGPDGDVYFGVQESKFPQHDARGWLLHFNASLTREKIPGSFGWDNTPSVVPASAVPGYHGTSPYLLLSKYNNYFRIGLFDVADHSVFVNNEDGILYRWDLATDTLAEQIRLNKPRPEAYTSTLIGPDGTVYAINNATLYAVGR